MVEALDGVDGAAGQHLVVGRDDGVVPAVGALEDQFYRAVDISDPTRPRETSRWWLPGTRKGDAEPPLPLAEKKPFTHCRVHNTNVYPQRPDRAYLGAGAIILRISEPRSPR